MYALKGTPSFRRKYIKLIKNNKELETRINMVLLQFVEDPWHRSLKTHKVKLPQLGEVYSSRVTGDIRIIWEPIAEDRSALELIDVGGHSGSKSVY